MKAAAILLTIASVASAAVRLPAVFSDHMVLQCDKPAAVWGWATPGEAIRVRLGGAEERTTAGLDGTWSLKLPKAEQSSDAGTLQVAGESNTITVKDVLVGEVWIASGQSNMEMRVRDQQHGSVDRAEEEVAVARFPQLRVFVHDESYSIYGLPVPPREAQADRPGRWIVCSPETVGEFSAIAYFFARDVHRELKVPVGIIVAAVGGTPIEAWTSESAQQSSPKLQPVLEDWQKRTANYDPASEQTAYATAKQKWLKQRAEAVKAKAPPPKPPSPFKNLRVMQPAGLFNGLVSPLIPYTLRGCIWYQGERNAAGPLSPLYGEQLKTMITDWRARWRDEFYFCWVQLPAFLKEQRLPSEPKGWGVAVREGMRRALRVRNTGMAVTLDLGGRTAGHPTNKAEFAARLSRLVLHDVYKRPIKHHTGPLYRSIEREGSRIVINFDHAEGLRAAAGELTGFAIAGADQKFKWASAKVDGEKVVVWADSISEPVSVRYGSAANPRANLVNGGGMPASPFQTDDW